jgi:lysophospholipase L1-like esterase
MVGRQIASAGGANVNNGEIMIVSRKLQLVAVAVALTAAAALPIAAQTKTATSQFDFGSGPAEQGFIQVLPTHLYSSETGFGFEPGSRIESVSRGGGTALASDFATSQSPFFFSVKLPAGNYNVTLTLGDLAGESTTTVKAELRRLMLENIKTAHGEIKTERITVNVRTPQIAGDGEVRLKDREKTNEMWAWDEKLTLEFSGARPCVCGLTIERADNVPTLYLLGDSTVCDQPREPYASWGQMLTRFFKPGIAVANHAESGESLRSSRSARRLDKVLSTMRPGDWLLIQYGHNDMKAVDAAAYKAELKRFVEQARQKGGDVVVITPMHRRTFDGERITNSHRDFPDAVRQLAAEENVPLIDLHAMSQKLYEAWGPEKSVAAFAPRDGTHHNNYGAYELAKCVIEGIRQNKLDLAGFIRDDVPAFDPSHPDPIATFAVPPSPQSPAQKPDGS